MNESSTTPEASQTPRDYTTIRREIETLCDEFGAQEARKSILDCLSAFLGEERRRVSQNMIDDPANAGALRRDIADAVDIVVSLVFAYTVEKRHPNIMPTKGERVALLAVGGYGRREMAPFSDVDLLFLTPYKQTAWAESVVETILYFLWDLGLKVGHSVRSLDDCITLGTQDITIRTALLEARHLCGDAELSQKLETDLQDKLFSKTVSEFIEAKLEERAQRHAKSGNARYVLEPNIKEGKGGLRDLQTLYWLGKYITGRNSPQELVEEGFFSQDEYQTFEEAETFLWTVRNHLHDISKRPNEILSFDMQMEIAARFGYKDSKKRRGVEKFMQAYFRQARQVGELTRVFVTELETRHLRTRTGIGTFFRHKRLDLKLPDGFTVNNGRLDFASDDVIQDPMNILRIFAHGIENDILIHPHAFRLMAWHLDEIDDEFRQSKEANRYFLNLLTDYGNPERALRRMNEIGVLGAWIPKWRKIDAMMQYNMYHSYTVDEHTIRCISILAELERGEHIEDLPIVSEILSKKQINRKVIYVALLLHDIGKGRRKPHELVGEKIARILGRRFGLDDYDVEFVAWLVRNHLVMSDVAQKRDLSDPKTIRDFVEIIGDKEHLDHLLVLTVCDIRGVGPNVWNNWKAVLLRELYAVSLKSLEDGGVVSAQDARELKAKDALRAVLSTWSEKAIEAELERHYADYWIGLSTDIQAVFATLMSSADLSQIQINIASESARDATRIAFAMPDHPGLFARLCGALSLAGADIVDARTYTSSDGMATAVFWVQDELGGCYQARRHDKLQKTIDNILQGKVLAREALAKRDKIKKRERGFRVPTRIRFDNDGSRIFTIIEINTRDRKGLLYDLSRTLSACNISISSAIIATYGEEAVDSFYVKDVFGLKIHNSSKQKAIEAKLIAAIEKGEEEALRS